jgi:hypothetical protein
MSTLFRSMFAAACGALALLSATASFAKDEVMTDRCSHEVSIVGWGENAASNNAIVLKRGSHGKTDWTPPFTVKLSEDGHIRWWCHSTTGNAFDPGTWRIQEIYAGTKCKIYADNSVDSCGPDGALKIGSSEWKGWTPERSRCGNRSNKIRARLDGNRKLLIHCLPKG